jgi:hypothetical protein
MYAKMSCYHEKKIYPYQQPYYEDKGSGYVLDEYIATFFATKVIKV